MKRKKSALDRARENKAREEARHSLSLMIAQFERECARHGYTDTGTAWELLREARRLLRRER